MAVSDLLAVDARTALRVLCGVAFIPHTVIKLSNIDRSAQFFEKIGFRPTRFFVVLTATMEVVAAVGLIFNLYPRLAALIAATVLLIAAWAVTQVHGLAWRWQFQGPEYMLFWALACLIAGFLA